MGSMFDKKATPQKTSTLKDFSTPETVQPHLKEVKHVENKPVELNQHTETEQAFLSLALRNPDLLLDNLKPEDFFVGEHVQIARAIVELRELDFGCDPITISNQILSTTKNDLFDYLSELYALQPPVEHGDTYAHAIAEHAFSRRVRDTSLQIQRVSESPISALAKRQLIDNHLEILDDNMPASDHFGTAAEGAVEMGEAVERAGTGESDLVMTGYHEVDAIINGLMPGDLMILAGRPGMGKTALAMNIAEKIASVKEGPKGEDLEGDVVAVFSMEMSRAQLSGRMVCSLGSIDSKKLRRGALTGQEWDRYNKATETLRNMEVHIDDRPNLSVEQIRAGLRKLIRRGKKPAVVFIDYLQLMAGKGNNRHEEISFISRRLKALAKELGTRVIALSQLNRELEKRADKRPMISDLRESGALEQDADVIVMVYRDEVYYPDSPNRGEAEVLVPKNRAGGNGFAVLRFNGAYTRFESKPLIDNGEQYVELA